MQAKLTDSLEYLYTDSDAAQTGSASLAVDVPRGSIAAVHVLLNDLPAKGDLRLSVRQRGRAVAAAKWFRLVDVPVEANTGLGGFVEKTKGENPHVARRAPFRVYDAMQPVRSAVKVVAPTMALRLHIPIPPDQRPGKRELDILIGCGRDEAQLRFTVRIAKAIVPPPGRESFPYTNWFSLGFMASCHGLKPWSEAHWRMIRRYADLMVHGRQNMFWTGSCWSETAKRTDKGIVLNRARLRRLVKCFSDAGMYWIEGSHLGAPSGGDYKAPTYQIALNGPRATSLAGYADLAGLTRQLVDEIDRNGWRERWIQHVADEPGDPASEAEEHQILAARVRTEYRILAGMVRRLMPGFRILEAASEPSLAGSINTWCPRPEKFLERREQFRTLQSAGDVVWFYVCCQPGGAYLNRFMDQQLLRPALLGWAGALYELEGFLHWGLNHYQDGQDPFAQSVVPHRDVTIPAGDTHIVYPGPDGPWSSVRLEAQREGLEDCELLRRLQRDRSRSAKAVLARAIRSFTDYTTSAADFRAARGALLKAMER